MEENLSLSELEAILGAAREQQHNHHKFLAALKGITLDEPDEDKFAEVEARAKAKAAGISKDQYEFSDLGFEVESDVA